MQWMRAHQPSVPAEYWFHDEFKFNGMIIVLYIYLNLSNAVTSLRKTDCKPSIFSNLNNINLTVATVDKKMHEG